MSQIKYKCLMIDHDDTAVDSSREIHYPCFVKTVETFRPGEYILTLEEFMNACFYPGLYDYYTRILGFTKEELDLELEMWQNYVKERVPHFYEGIGEILSDFRASGGVIAVSSQSHRDVILRDYTARLGFVPDLIYGCELPPDKCKPSTYSIDDACREIGITPDDVLVVDDLRTGLEMAKRAGAHFAAAGWSHFVPEIKRYMRENSSVYLDEVAQLKSILIK